MYIDVCSLGGGIVLGRCQGTKSQVLSLRRERDKRERVLQQACSEAEHWVGAMERAEAAESELDEVRAVSVGVLCPDQLLGTACNLSVICHP